MLIREGVEISGREQYGDYREIANKMFLKGINPRAMTRETIPAMKIYL
jgi:hypothetical protein